MNPLRIPGHLLVALNVLIMVYMLSNFINTSDPLLLALATLNGYAAYKLICSMSKWRN